MLYVIQKYVHINKRSLLHTSNGIVEFHQNVSVMSSWVQLQFCSSFSLTISVWKAGIYFQKIIIIPSHLQFVVTGTRVLMQAILNIVDIGTR